MLVSAVCTRMESACRRDHAPALIVVCNGAAIMLAAAARCEAEVDAMCVLVSASGTRMESACRRDHMPALIVVCDGADMKLRLLLYS